jgi:acyl-CoA dehydrogenase family protein 9
MSATNDAAITDKKRATRLLRDQSIAKNLIMGEIVEENLFPYPAVRSRDREILGQIVEAIDDFLADKARDFQRWDREGAQPAEFIQALRELGLFSLIIPEEFGGLALSNAAYSRVLAQTSSYDSSVSLTIGAHSSIGMKGILLFGTPEQRARYLPRLATGELIAAFCLTESGAGSDAASIRTAAQRNEDGSWRLNGEKIWITNGGIADLCTVFARTDGPEGKITAFLVETAWPGVTRGTHEDKMGIRASSTASVAFADVRVPADNVLGEVGKGFKVAMSILNNGRTGLGGGAVGGMKALIRMAGRQAQERRQFGRPIAEFGLVRAKIAQMVVECFAAESAVWMVAHYIDEGSEDYSTEAAISKVFASEAMQRAAYEALQIAAGAGYMRELPYEQIVRDARILPIFEGTNEILRLYVALSCLKGVGESLSELKVAAASIFNHPIKGFGLMTDYAERRFAQATGVGRDRVRHPLAAPLRPLADDFEKYATELASVADESLRRHGKRVADDQALQGRIADVLIDLFVGLCVISRADAIGKADPGAAEQVRAIAAVFTRQARQRMSLNLRRITHNDDDAVEAIAVQALERGYSWDVI